MNISNDNDLIEEIKNTLEREKNNKLEKDIFNLFSL
jgi:flagellin-specific chaperone FliS